MKIISKSNDIYLINGVKRGINSNGKEWYMAQLENADGRINLFLHDFNAGKVVDGVGRKCYLITEYVENYNKKTDKKYIGCTIKDVIFVD